MTCSFLFSSLLLVRVAFPSDREDGNGRPREHTHMPPNGLKEGGHNHSPVASPEIEIQQIENQPEPIDESKPLHCSLGSASGNDIPLSFVCLSTSQVAIRSS